MRNNGLGWRIAPLVLLALGGLVLLGVVPVDAQDGKQPPKKDEQKVDPKQDEKKADPQPKGPKGGKYWEPPSKEGLDSKVTAIPDAIIKKFKLDSKKYTTRGGKTVLYTEFYKKHLDYKGFSILSSINVSDEGLYEARHLMHCMLWNRDDILKGLIKDGARFMVMTSWEQTTDVPEQSGWERKMDQRARGMGGQLSSCGEENLLNLKGDRYNAENILIHEFNHAVHQRGLKAVDPTFGKRLQAAFQNAKSKGLWKGTYLMENAGEYWAEAVQAYFETMRPQYQPKIGDKNMSVREKMEKYDPDLFKLVDEVYKKSEYRYVRYDVRYPDKKGRTTALPPGTKRIIPGETDAKKDDPKKADPKKDEPKKADPKKDGKLFRNDLLTSEFFEPVRELAARAPWE